MINRNIHFFYTTDCEKYKFQCNPDKHDPKCATDGKVYQNGCYLGEAICWAKVRGESLRFKRCEGKQLTFIIF